MHLGVEGGGGAVVKDSGMSGLTEDSVGGRAVDDRQSLRSLGIALLELDTA